MSEQGGGREKKGKKKERKSSPKSHREYRSREKGRLKYGYFEEISAIQENLLTTSTSPLFSTDRETLKLHQPLSFINHSESIFKDHFAQVENIILSSGNNSPNFVLFNTISRLCRFQIYLFIHRKSYHLSSPNFQNFIDQITQNSTPDFLNWNAKSDASL